MAKDKTTAEAEKLSEEEKRQQVEERRINPPTPADLDEYKGKYRYLGNGEIFGLKILPADQVRGNKTHHAKSARFFWDGTPEQFRAQFDKL